MASPDGTMSLFHPYPEGSSLLLEDLDKATWAAVACHPSVRAVRSVKTKSGETGSRWPEGTGTSRLHHQNGWMLNGTPSSRC